jgi:hypothetical protein
MDHDSIPTGCVGGDAGSFMNRLTTARPCARRWCAGPRSLSPRSLVAPIDELIKIACPASTPIRDEIIWTSHHRLWSVVAPPE